MVLVGVVVGDGVDDGVVLEVVVLLPLAVLVTL